MCQYCKIHGLKRFGKYRHDLNGYSVVTKGEGMTEKANKRGEGIHEKKRVGEENHVAINNLCYCILTLRHVKHLQCVTKYSESYV